MQFGALSRPRFILGGLTSIRFHAVASALIVMLILWQTARLFWAVASPIGAVGDWRPATIRTSGAGMAELRGFDPFFRLEPGGEETVVTSLELKLFGVRVDSASGRGSAIIATPDGVQSSVAVGEEIMPGVTLAQVAFDNVTISRGGVTEQIFLDQSVAAPVAQPGTNPPADSATSGSQLLANNVALAPRIENGKMSGMTLTPKGDGALFKAAGLEPGDVLVAVNGKPISEGDDIRSLLANGGSASLEVERGGRRLTVSAKTGQ